MRYYDAARGYCGPESAGEERDRFAICLATTDGGLYHAGDHEAPFALQFLSKVFVYGLALADRGRDRVLERVGVEPSPQATIGSTGVTRPCSAAHSIVRAKVSATGVY